MSQIPQSLKDLKAYLVAKTGREGKNFGIRGTVGARRAWGYHLGKSDIYSANGYKDKDYSVKHPRNKAGLSEASAGFDIRLPVKQLIALVAFLVSEAKAGKADLMEIIGPDAQGEAKRYALPKWEPTDARDDHEWHIHLGFPRDTEFGDRVAMFRAHFDGTPVPPPPPPPDPGEPPPEPPEDPDDPEIARLQNLLKEIGPLADAIKVKADG